MKTRVWGAALGLVALVASSCGPDDTSAELELSSATVSPMRQQVASVEGASCEPDTTAPTMCSVWPDNDGDPNTPPPCTPFAAQDVLFECTGHGNNQWAAPEIAAQDLCEGTLPFHQYNTGDDDQDGIPGCDCNYFPCGGEGVPEGDNPATACDEDDFGPGPSTETEGLYYVQYLAWDEAYNMQSATLSVYVKDTIKPTIELLGPPNIQTECYLPMDGDGGDPDPFVDPGVNAQDICYGDLNQEVFGYGDIIKSQPGTYTIEYTVRDGAYNWADPATRGVVVLDRLPPEVTSKPPLPIGSGGGWMRRMQLSECVVAIKDRCEGYLDINARAEISQITSNEPGSDAGDIVIHDNSTFEVRVKPNSDGTQRVYSVDFAVIDNSGNWASSQCTLYVPGNGG